MKTLCTLLLAYVLSSSIVNAQRKYDSSHTQTAKYSNSVRVVEIINLQTNFTVAIEKYKEINDGGRKTSLWDYAQRKYAEILCIYLSNDELLEIINTYPNLTNEKYIKCISFVQSEAYRQGELGQLLLNNSSYVEATKKASNPDLSHEERIRILDEVHLDIKGEGLIGPNRVAGD